MLAEGTIVALLAVDAAHMARPAVGSASPLSRPTNPRVETGRGLVDVVSERFA